MSTVFVQGKPMHINFKGPRSVCVCNHYGDTTLDALVGKHQTGDAEIPVLGPTRRLYPSQHGGLLAHGPCSVTGCLCQKFTWRGWTPGYATALRLAQEAARFRGGP